MAHLFIVGAGRCGSTSVASLLCWHDKIDRVYHEYGGGRLVRSSTLYEYGDLSDRAWADELADLFPPMDGELVATAHFKTFNAIATLAALYPTSRFLWLIRSGPASVRSLEAHGWYDDDRDRERLAALRPSLRWDSFERWRLSGFYCGVPEWHSLDAHERRCWYWGYVNSRIATQLSPLDADRWRVLAVEQMGERLPEVWDWIGESDPPPGLLRLNVSSSTARPFDADEQAAFVRRADWLQSKLYGRER